MSTVPVPLDIGFYDADGRPVDSACAWSRARRAEAECPLYSADGPYQLRARDAATGELPSRPASPVVRARMSCHTPGVASVVDRSRRTIDC